MMAANPQTAAFSNKEFQSCFRGVHLFLDVQQGEGAFPQRSRSLGQSFAQIEGPLPFPRSCTLSRLQPETTSRRFPMKQFHRRPAGRILQILGQWSDFLVICREKCLPLLVANSDPRY